MDLAVHQRKILGLIKSTYQPLPDDDPYILKVAQSGDLEEARTNIFLWQVHALERGCPLTYRLLSGRGILVETLKEFIAGNQLAAYREEQAPAFLEALGRHADSVIASVAQFELALLKVKQGAADAYEVYWNIEPHGLLNSLARNIPLAGEIPEGRFRTRISRDLPHQFETVSLADPLAGS